MISARDYLQDLLTEIRLLESFTTEGEQAFYADERTQYAVMMAYARIGEIAKRLPESLLATQPEAEWREIKGFRDVLPLCRSQSPAGVGSCTEAPGSAYCG